MASNGLDTKLGPKLAKGEQEGRGKSSDSASQQTGYWENYLSGTQALELPTDHPRPATLASRMGVASCGLEEALSAGFHRLACDVGVEEAVTGVALFAVLLYRYSAQDQFVVALERSDAQRLPIVVDFSGRPSFRHLVRQIETAVNHGSKAGAILADGPAIAGVNSDPNSDPSRHSVFQVAVSAGTGQESSLSSITPLLHSEGPGLDLRLELFGDSESSLRLHYNEELFEAVTAKRMLDHMQQLIAGVVADADRPCTQLPMLTDIELRELLVERNQTAREFSKKCLHELIEGIAARMPDEIAVVYGQEQLSYREFNARANQIAHYLRNRGGGRDGRVGICLGRSLDFAVAILGVLKAGGTCVPLDPNYPNERLSLMLNDVAAPIVLTELGLLQAPVPSGTQVLYFSQERQAVAQESRGNPSIGSSASDIAYIIYTSGSTGRPRGVLLPHAGLANYMQAAAEWFELRPGDRMLQFCSISFDAALEEMFATWVAGATLVFRNDDVSLDPGEFLGWVGKQRVSVMDLPTAYWHEWVYAMPGLSQKVPPSVRLVIVGGEKASSEAYSTWHKLVGSRVRWVNTYGPAEASVVATAYEPTVKPGEAPPAVLPIGRPVANARVYLLDPHLNPVPVGVPGELHIGGAGVARGYLNLPQLTEEKFISDPFSDVASARLYKTGDLARYLPNGEIEFVGRRDNQVKIRGFRVEPGEIESALIQHSGVHEAAVILSEDEQGNKRLVGYVVRSQQDGVRESDLRGHVQKRLPEYMVPAEFVFLKTMPLTPNGKINRKVLATAKRDLTVETAPSATVADPLQAKLIKIWEELLGRKGIGIGDNFFDLGGHSLLAARLMHRVKQITGKTLPLALLLQAPTVEKLAALLRDGWSERWPSLVAIHAEGLKPPFFCVHGVGGNVVGFQELARHMKPHYPFYGLQSQGLDGKQACLANIEEMAARYLDEIREVQPGGPYHLGGFSMGGLVAYEMAFQLLEQGEDVGLVVLFDTYATNPKPVKESMMDLLLHPTWAQVKQLPDEVRKKIRRTYLAWRLPEDLRKIMRNNAQAAQRYSLRPYRGKAILLRAGDTWRVAEDPYSKWSELIGNLETIRIPGSHMEILREPHVSRLAARLKSCIDGAAFGQAELVISKGGTLPLLASTSKVRI